LAHAKIIEKRPKEGHETTENSQKPHKFSCFYGSQNEFLFLNQINWHMQKSLENDQRKVYEITEKSPKSKIMNFYASQKYPNIYRPPEIRHTKKLLKIIPNQAKLP
jgi:hypothetical protein